MWGMRKQKRSRGTPGPLALVSSRSKEASPGMGVGRQVVSRWRDRIL